MRSVRGNPWKVLLCALSVVCVGMSAGASGYAFVTTTDFATGSSSVIQLDGSYSTQLNVASLHSDAVSRYFWGQIYVVNRYAGDNIQILDPDNAFSTVRQFSVGTFSDPHDIFVINGTKAYVTRYNETTLWIVDPSTGSNTGSIDLSGFTDPDGMPEMDQMARVGNHVFVTIQRLDRTTTWGPVGTSYIAVVDITTDTLVDVDLVTPGDQSIELAGSNPASDIRLNPWTGKLSVSCVGFWGLQDGGIEIVDPLTFESEGFVITETAVGGDINDFVIVSEHKGYAIVTDANFHTVLIAFDPSTGTKTGTLYAPGDYVLNDIELSPDGELFLADRTPTLPGIRVYDVDTDMEITTNPIDVGLPPFDIAFSVTVQTGIKESVPTVAALGKNYPNPFNPSTRIPFSLEKPLYVEIAIFDVLGRHIKTLVDEPQTAGLHETIWDGRNQNGVFVSSGVYFVRMDAADVRFTQKTILLK